MIKTIRETVADMKTKYMETAHVVAVLHFHFHVQLKRFAGCYPSQKITDFKATLVEAASCRDRFTVGSGNTGVPEVYN